MEARTIGLVSSGRRRFRKVILICMVCKWDSESESFGESTIAQNGIDHGSRDGMSVITKLSDGNYAMVIESTAVGAELAGNATFVIKMSFSQDGIIWTEPVTVAQPENLGQKATSGENAVCASPYVVTLPDGRLAISYQTTDRYTGLTPARVSYAVGSQVAISNEAIVYSEDTAPTVSTASFTKITEGPGELAENAFSKSTGLLCSDGYLLAYYNNGSNTAESAFTFSNVEVAAMKLPEAESSGESLDGYELYNNSSNNRTINNVKLTDGKFTFPEAISTLLRTEPYSANQPAYKTKITGLYDEASYTQVNKDGKALVFDADNKTVTNQAGEQSRNWIKGTEYMQGFSAKATIKGASNGAIQAGFGFHMQQKDFTPETFAFSTSGYTVMIVRSATSLSKFTVRVRYISGTTVKAVTSDFSFLSDDTDEKITLSVWADNCNFYVVAATEDGSKTTGTLTYPLNNGTIYYPSGGFMLTANGTAVFSNFELSRSTYLKRAQNLEASADIELAATNQNQAGFVLRVQDTDIAKKGSTSYTVSGYAVRIVNDYTADTKDNLKLILSRLGTNSDGIECTKLGDMYSVDVTEAICGTDTPSTQTVNMKATVIGSTLTVVLTNKADASLTETYTFDLKKSAGGYDNYYSYGGFGLFKNTSKGSISNVSFKVLSSEENINKLNPESYTVYQQGTGGRFDTDRFVSDNASGKKIILNSATVTDFTADAVFKISTDGQLKAGIIFRAQSIGNSQDDMEGYSCCVYKTDNKTGNYGRIVLLVYKWARQADGTLSYLGTVGSKPNLTALNSVYPLAESNILGAAGAHIRLKLKVEGTKAKAEFEVLDDNNAAAVSSGETVFDLTKTPTGVSGSKTFNDDAYNTVFNAGAIGLSISSKGEICDFNIDAADNVAYRDIAEYDFYSNSVQNDYDAFTRDNTNKKFYAITNGMRQAVLTGSDLSSFRASGTFKSNSAGADYNMGFDFMINEETHSGYASDGAKASQKGFDGYRILFLRSTTADTPQKAYLYLFRMTSTINEDGTYSYSRTQLAVKYLTEFFDLDKYGEVEVKLTVSLGADGKLTATAVRVDAPEKQITLTYDGATEFSGKSGAVGWYIRNKGSVTEPVIEYDIEDALVVHGECENGFVYTALNSGAANIGDTVKLVAVPANEGEIVGEAYYYIGDKKYDIPYSREGYIFSKQFGKSVIYASFGRFAPGDLDKNGTVNAADMVCLRQDLLDIKPYDPAVANCNGDESVDIRDLVNLKKALANPS